ncbi:MAG: phytanoyl-CoA dioxygenase family protein [Gammaproteobacteria bacterium]
MSNAGKYLLSDEITYYQREGFVIPRQALPGALFNKLNAALEERLKRLGDQPPDFIPLPHVPCSDADEKSLENARAFFEIATDDFILDNVEQIIGSDIVLWASALFCKPAATGLEVPWHQDGQYWPIRPRANVTVWIAIDDVNKENACLRVIPGSHRMGEFAHETSDREDLVLNNVLKDERIDINSAVDIELNAGQFSMHDVDLVHGSQKNSSGRRRAGYALRYMPASSCYDRQINPGQASATVPLDFVERPIWLVRGKNLNPGNDFTIGHTLW